MQNNDSELKKYHCALIKNSTFQKGETILDIKDMSAMFGMLEAGNAHISGIDKDGNEVIRMFMEAGDCFGNLILFPVQDLEYYAIADTFCSVSFINIHLALKGCGRRCSSHDKLISSLLLLISKNLRSQNAYTYFLSRKSTREKLIAYFNYLREYSALSDTFILPMTYSDLAAYLCVDRAAMMREIKKMKDEGLIVSKGKAITICY